MSHDLEERLRLVRRCVELSTEPLDAPLGLVFRPVDGEAHLRAWSEHAARVAAGAAYAPATLYVHVPFCARVCTYCLLSAVRTPGKDAVSDYVGALRREIALYEPVVRGLRFGSVHVGGGTPTLLDERQLDAVFSDLSRLPLADGAQIGVEAHPGTSTPGRLAVLRRHGVDRVSFGVETLTPEVLRRVNREDQSEARVIAAIAEARRLGFAVNVDLLAGLPGETAASWNSTVRRTLALEPDSMSVNRFLGENSLLARYGFSPGADENARVDAMLTVADSLVREVSPPRWPEERLRVPGFGTQYVWDRSETARRYFQDDMIGPVSTLALGHGALGHIYGRSYGVKGGARGDYVAHLERGEPPDALECTVDERFEMAFFVTDRACRGDLSTAAFRRVFGRALGDTFRPEIDFLLKKRLLRANRDRLSKPQDPAFQTVHLLAFLAFEAQAVEERIRSLQAAGDDPAGAVPVVHSEEDVEALLAPETPQGRANLSIDVGEGVDADTATRIAHAATERRGLVLDVVDDGRRTIRQYESLRTELPPSMLWVRLAIRAAQAARGEQTTARIRGG